MDIKHIHLNWIYNCLNYPNYFLNDFKNYNYKYKREETEHQTTIMI